MFILSELEDKVRIEPADLGRPTVDAVTAVIEQLYLDKVGMDACNFHLRHAAYLHLKYSAGLINYPRD